MVKSSLFKFVIPYPGSAVTCSFVTPDFYRGLDQIRAADKFISFFPSMFIVRNTLPFLWCRKFRAQTASRYCTVAFIILLKLLHLFPAVPLFWILQISLTLNISLISSISQTCLYTQVFLFYFISLKSHWIVQWLYISASHLTQTGSCLCFHAVKHVCL